MAMDYTTSYAKIVKFDKNDDGTIMVYGKATDDTLDLDSQICDPKWLDTAMPRWFKSGGNIREMHGPSAAGIAKEYEAKGDGHYINVHVVDPIAAKKVETGVYQGFSIGIKSPRVIQDSKAANGRIVDGQIIEVSLVDRPANPSAKLILAKTVEGEATLVQVEEVVEKHGDHDQSDHNPHGGGGSSSSDKPSSGTPRTEDNDNPNRGLYHGSDKIENSINNARELHQSLQNNPHDDPARDRAAKDVEKARTGLERAYNAETKEEAKDSLRGALKDTNRAFNLLEDQNYHSEAEAAHELAVSITNALVAVKSVQPDETLTNKGKSKMEKINQITELAKSLTTIDVAKFDRTLFDNARRALAELIAAEALEMKEGHDERGSLASLAGAVNALMDWYEGEQHEGEVMEMEMKSASDVADTEREEAVGEKASDAKMCDKCGKAADECTCEKSADADETTEEEKAHKGAEGEDSVAEEAPEAPADETPADAPIAEVIAEAVEEAVKSAMKSVEAKMVALQADKEAAVAKAVSLETELKDALNKAVAGGPKRTATDMPDNTKNDALVKAAIFKSKMDATTDPLLYKGFSDLRDAELRKAGLLAD